ncbi:hypothetical protein GTP81_28060 [Rugamonas sp. FT107W]|uniref:Uncharacterized protein n=1 Tax=Duganella vulcania TaxID=2692166 RepID=A0A845HP90_9BURK|nr:hypothetical protein [Duganella vulcania]MYN20601.1 hypothetical protein [Duganella vulcania]
MKSAKSKWLAYTVIVGLIPIVARMLTCSAGFSMASMALGVVAFYYLPRVKEK